MKKKEKEKLIAEHFKLMASQFRMIEMCCEVALPEIGQANAQGTIRDSLKAIAKSLVAIAEVTES